MAGIAPQIPGCRDLSLIGERVARSLFSATSDRLGRPVTVIAYPPLSEGRTEADFDRAAATAQRLGVHPSMISIHEWGHADDHRPWIITDPQPAEALDTLLKLDGPLEIERALQMGVLLAGALETAHGAGIIHGDLSPARVVVGPHGEPLMTETGLAPFAVFPGLGALNNPVRYHAPPEVLESTDIAPATDVYSLATTVYALIAGRAPQEKPAEVTDSNASLLLRVLQMAPPPIDRPDLPPGMLEALRGPLAPDPRKRPQQAIEVAWLLQDVQRRAGFAITEPVVLDLDDIEHHRSRRAGSYPAPALPPAKAPVPEPAPAAPAWGTWSGPIDIEGPSIPAAPAAPTPGGPRWSPPPIPDLRTKPPLLPAQQADEAEPTEAPPAGGILWPSSWPAAEPEADLPAWARQPASPQANGDAPPATPEGPASAGELAATAQHPEIPTPAAEGPPDLPPWAQPTESRNATPERTAAPPWLQPTDSPAAARDGAAGPSDPAPRQPGDLPPWGQLLEPPKPADERPADRPPWAEPAEPAAPVPPADLPWAPPSAPTPEATADRPSLPKRRDQADETAPSAQPPALPKRRDQADETAPSAQPPALPKRREHADEERPAWAQFPPPPDWLKGEATPPAERAGDAGPGANAGSSAGLPGWARAKPGDGTGADDGEPPWLPGAETNSSFAVARPPELDILPAWYTDPLPLGGNGSSNGHMGAASSERLPGAGDELRSLFGAVVGEPPALPPLPPEPEPFSADPLGPPTPRPPLDLRKLEDPFGSSAPPPPPPPPPAAKVAPVRATGGIEKPLRLPRPPLEAEPPRVPSGSAPGGRAYPPPDQARSSRTSTREERSEQAAPVAPTAPQPESATGGSPPVGPPALPVIVLVVVLAVLVLGIVWLVITGDDSGTPADEPAPDAVALAPTGLTVTPGPGGDQLAWQGEAEATYVVTVLSPTAPPQALPAAPGLSALVPTAGASAPGQQCYTVAVAPGEAGGEPGPASEPACPPGVSPASMMPAP